MTDYADLLNKSNLKATFQRIQLLESIGEHGHMSVEAIYDEVVKMHPSLSLATVYKNIILMVQKGVLVEVPIAGKKSKYELRKEDHIHLVCTACGEVEDKPLIPETDILLNSLTYSEHFKLVQQQINLYGICKSCQKNM
ncbi:Peroxide stress regulator; Ferric uptake regulation protein; Fe2+/Zn2+ uptake regulation proteins [hydrothermal vent metagenome]|uniref:Peroxide stress regulator Ferric uptake regulation protein Fe2+/Zn2+ uptake regulation proteins n=1 Tax=hydrothermal vent metagenome TaxID=652676 RepID=A0A1W1C7S2_9ZZZZ